MVFSLMAGHARWNCNVTPPTFQDTATEVRSSNDENGASCGKSHCVKVEVSNRQHIHCISYPHIFTMVQRLLRYNSGAYKACSSDDSLSEDIHCCQPLSACEWVQYIHHVVFGLIFFLSLFAWRSTVWMRNLFDQIRDQGVVLQATVLETYVKVFNKAKGKFGYRAKIEFENTQGDKVSKDLRVSKKMFEHLSNLSGRLTMIYHLPDHPRSAVLEVSTNTAPSTIIVVSFGAVLLLMGVRIMISQISWYSQSFESVGPILVRVLAIGIIQALVALASYRLIRADYQRREDIILKDEPTDSKEQSFSGENDNKAESFLQSPSSIA